MAIPRDWDYEMKRRYAEEMYRMKQYSGWRDDEPTQAATSPAPTPKKPAFLNTKLLLTKG